MSRELCWNEGPAKREPQGEGWPLEKRDDGGGARHFLQDRPIHCGTQLMLRVDKDKWVYARYEACFRGNVIAVMLYTMFGLVTPDEHTVLRWPTEAEK